MLSACKLFGVWAVTASVACGDTLVAPPIRAVALHVRAAGSDAPFVVNVGVELALEAIPITADSVLAGPAVNATWHSSDTTIATVSEHGILHSYCVGTTLITASTSVTGNTVSGMRPVTIATTGPTCAGR